MRVILATGFLLFSGCALLPQDCNDALQAVADAT